MAAPIFAFWCRYPSRPNFGDALTPWLIKMVTGRHPAFLLPHALQEKVFVVGSIIRYARQPGTVWGAGILNRNDLVASDLKIAAVRGPLTRARALAAGARCPAVYGDPALLLPRFFRPQRRRRTQLGIVPHYCDRPIIELHWRSRPGVRLIDVQNPVERVIDEIASCDCVASSSLHGLIVAAAYGVPNLWVEFTHRPHGDGSKFEDYFCAVGQEPYRPVPVAPSAVRPADLIRRMRSPEIRLDLDPLWAACPFRAKP